MATTTTNYGLTKPSYGDNADIAVINSNMDKIDAKMKEIEDAGGGGGSSVSWNQIQTSGSKIAEVTIDGTKTNVYAPNSGGGGSSDINYSTEEQQIGTWINGEILYRRVVELTMLDEGTYIYSLGSDTNVVNALGYIVTDKYKFIQSGFWSSDGVRVSAPYQSSDGQLKIYIKGYTPTKVICIVEYIKTTNAESEV